MTCAAHLLHKCAIKMKSYFDGVDQLITKVKSATLENKIRRAKFFTIGCLPQPVVTRWGSWLNPVLYEAKDLHEVTANMESLQGYGILVTRAKVSLEITDFATQLLKIKGLYECPVKLRDMMESTKYTITRSRTIN